VALPLRRGSWLVNHMHQDSMSFYAAVPLALVVVLAAVWHFLRQRGESERSIRLNFDAHTAREAHERFVGKP